MLVECAVKARRLRVLVRPDEAAELDARSALTQTQAKAVQTKLAELQGQLDGSGAAQTEASP